MPVTASLLSPTLLYDPEHPRPDPKELTDDERRALKEACTRSLGDFIIEAWDVLEPNTPLKWGFHLDAVADHVQAVLEGPRLAAIPGRMPRTGFPRAWVQNLLINVPPGTMKSLIVSVFAPAWIWISRPSYRGIFASGNPRVATRDSMKCRDLLKSDWYQRVFEPGWKFAEDSDAKLLFKNTKGGFRQTLSVAAPVTGDRADGLFIDDPNDAADVTSKAERDRVNYWYDYAFANRLNDPDESTRMIIMQRLHEEDLAGHILEGEGDGWAHLCIPMEYDSDGKGTKPTFLGWVDPRAKDGELLMPARFSRKYLDGELRRLGSSGYAGQMQQRPSPAEGDKFKRTWWKFWREEGQPLTCTRPKGSNDYDAALLPKAFDEVVESWDLTFKGKVSNDWVVGVKVGRIGSKKFVIGFIRRHTGFAGAKKAIIELRQRAAPCFMTLVEDKANGPAVIQDLEGAVTGLIAVEPQGGKEARAAVLEPQVEAGDWYLPDGAVWLNEFIDEFATFPNAKHDDIVDAVSQAAVRLSQSGADLAYAQTMCAW